MYLLTENLVFPPIELTSEEGILAVGGDLRPERLLLAYSNGIFPWYSEYEPILWWSPDPRFVLYPNELKVSKSMRPYFNQKKFKITFDTAFRQVVEQCKQKERPGQDGTWIVPDMLEAYCRLHELGLAHSVEAWKEGELVAGLYGISLGRTFFGESMFTNVSNGSKVAFITLVRCLIEKEFDLIDSQVYTNHLASLGAVEIPRKQYISDLKTSLQYPTLQGNWGELLKG